MKKKKCNLLVFYIVIISWFQLAGYLDNLTREYDKNQIFFVVGYEMGIWLGLQLNLR